MCKTVLVTGAAGMIGSHTVQRLLDTGFFVVGVDRCESSVRHENYSHYVVDLLDSDALKSVFESETIERVIHLAALAHTAGVKDLSFQTFYKANVLCSVNVFKSASANDVPVLFSSTVDVFGFTDGKAVCADAPVSPVTAYGKTKALAEEECKSICRRYAIFRFSPVYSQSIKRDIQKRYYLKFPDWAYIIGKGSEYEVLNIDSAVDAIVEWCGREAENEIRIIKDPDRLKTVECLREEKREGRAKHLLHFPRWLVKIGYFVLRVSGKNKFTYLLNKAVYPLRTE